MVSVDVKLKLLFHVPRNRRFIRDGEPRMSTSTFTQLLTSDGKHHERRRKASTQTNKPDKCQSALDRHSPTRAHPDFTE